MNTRISDAAVEAAIDAYENAPGVMQFPAMKAALEAYEAHKAEQQGADVRAQFEAWAKGGGYGISRATQGGKPIDHYDLRETRIAWRTWQAALSTVQPKQFHHVKQVAEHFNMAVTPKEMAEAIAGMPSELCSKESAHAAFGHLAHVQPSPAGQGDDSDLLHELRDVEDYFEDVDPNPIHLATVQAAIEFVAARQPVDFDDKELQFYREHVVNDLDNMLMGAGVFEVTHEGGYEACWANSMGALGRLIDRQPVAVGAPSGWRLVPEIAAEEQLRAALDTGAYHDGEESARAILADEYRTMVAAAPPTQAGDLGRWSQRHADDLHEAIHTALSVHAGHLSQKKRGVIHDHVKRLLIDRNAGVGK